MFLQYLLILFISFCPQHTKCYSSGGPMEQCPYLYAKHKVDPQTSDTPYILNADKEFYMPNETISITLKTIDDDITFKGFMISVRRVTGDTESLIGTFTRYPENTQSYSWYPEDYTGENCITHSNAEPKSELNVEWTAPSISVGDVVIRAVVVQSKKVIWTTQNSFVVKSQNPNEEEFTNELTRAYRTIDSKECGKSKGCFVYPNKCSGIKCQFIVSWKYDSSSEEVEIQMSGNTEGYLAVTFADSEGMPSSKGFVCSHDDDTKRIESMHIPGYSVERDRISEMRDQYLGKDGDSIICKFIAPVASYIGYGNLEGTAWNLKDPHYVQVAKGHLYKDSDGQPQQHEELPIVSSQATSVTNYILMSSKGLSIDILLHVNFNLFARMALAGIAILVARHFQFIFKNRYCGSSVWVGIHISLNILTLVLMLIGITVLAVSLNGWTTEASLHGILGSVVTILMALLILSGFLRTKISSSYYVVFLWSHRILGYVTFLLAAYVCILGFQCHIFEPYYSRRGIIIVLAWLIFHIFSDLLFEANSFMKKAKADDNELSALTSVFVKESFSKEYVLLSIYLFGNLLFSAAGFYYVSI